MRKQLEWSDLLEEYLEHRRIFGNDLKRQSSILSAFIRYLDEIKFEGPLTAEVQVEWIRDQEGKTSYNRARKLSTLRQFAKYLSLFYPKTEIPPRGLFGKLQSIFNPHIYTEKELKMFFSSLRVLKNEDSFSSLTYEHAFKLMLCCGLRAGETTHLLDSDVDLEKGLITVVEGKFKKSRLIPIDESVVQALKQYKDTRDKQFPRSRCQTLFVVAYDRPMTYPGMQGFFQKVRKELGWRGYMEKRIHDFRHTFVVNRLIHWHRSNEDSEQKIAALSVYIGHARVSETYWYFHFVPELMDLVSKRFEAARSH